MRWRSLGGMRCAAQAGSRACRDLGPAALELGEEPLSDRRVRRRPEIEVGERGAQVEAGAADDDRSPALREQLVDLRVRQLGVLPRREARGDRDDAEQPVLEAGPLGGGRRAGEDLEPVVDLQRVGRHRHRVLPALAQPVGDGDRDLRLADGGRPEERERQQLPRTRFFFLQPSYFSATDL